MATRLSVGRDVGAGDTFDIIVEQARAATGEVQIGNLMFAGLDQGRKKTQLVKWNDGQWYEASGQYERRGTMGMPVAGHITSTFGLCRPPASPGCTRVSISVLPMGRRSMRRWAAWSPLPGATPATAIS